MKRTTSSSSISERVFNLFRAAMLGVVASAFVEGAVKAGYPRVLIIIVVLYLSAEAASKLYPWD